VSDDPLSQAVQELELVTYERDQARRELIAYDAIHGKISVVAAAKARGWGYLITEDRHV
jgi:hypothetical protein